MNEVHNNKDKDYYPALLDTTSNSSEKDERLLEVLKALVSHGFRVIDYHGN
jgi:hypothetical protein